MARKASCDFGNVPGITTFFPPTQDLATFFDGILSYCAFNGYTLVFVIYLLQA
jgi:hypothetical protein